MTLNFLLPCSRLPSAGLQAWARTCCLCIGTEGFVRAEQVLCRLSHILVLCDSQAAVFPHLYAESHFAFRIIFQGKSKR